MAKVAGTPAHEDRRTTPRWSWVALGAALAVWLAAFPTFGISVVLAPLTIPLSLVAWRRAPHDAVFWIGVALNALLALGFLIEIVAVLTGEASVGWE
jgi:hypothetical protein